MISCSILTIPEDLFWRLFLSHVVSQELQKDTMRRLIFDFR